MRQIGRTKEKSTLGKDSIVVGFSLFAMFFGAGNLIFPPTLGQLSGDLWAWGLVGFLLVDAVLSCLGVFVVSRLGGPCGAFDETLGKIGGTILTTVAILCLCVVFAMPRTAATTFELSVAPYLGEDANSFLVPFSILFFVIVYLLTCRKSRVVDIIGQNSAREHRGSSDARAGLWRIDLPRRDVGVAGDGHVAGWAARCYR